MLDDVRVYSARTGNLLRIERATSSGLKVVRKARKGDPSIKPAFVLKDGSFSLYPEGSEALKRSRAQVEAAKGGYPSWRKGGN